jgi:hypothetical protein
VKDIGEPGRARIGLRGREATMRKLVLFGVIALLADISGVEARPNTTQMSCGQAAATVARAGAIVLTTGDHTYERFVATNAFCLPGEIVEPGVAPTLDSPACQVGYVCRNRPQYNDD